MPTSYIEIAGVGHTISQIYEGSTTLKRFGPTIWVIEACKGNILALGIWRHSIKDRLQARIATFPADANTLAGSRIVNMGAELRRRVSWRFRPKNQVGRFLSRKQSAPTLDRC